MRNLKVLTSLLSIFILFLVIAVLSCNQQEPSSTSVLPLTTLTQPETSLSLVIPKTTVVQPATTNEQVAKQVPENDIVAYRLTIDGLVDSPLSLTYAAILQYPAITKQVWLICPGVFETNQYWTGVPLSLLLAKAGVKTGASRVVFSSSDGYKAELTLDDAQNDGTFVAYKVDGKILELGDGYPIRLVTVKEGSYWVRQLAHIEVE